MIKNMNTLNYPSYSKITPKEELSDPFFPTKENIGKIYILQKSIEVINKNGGAEMWCAGTPVVIADNDFEQKTIDFMAANGTHIVIGSKDKRYKGCFWANNVLEVPSNIFLLLNAFTNPTLWSSIPVLGIPLIFLSLIMCVASYIPFWVCGLLLIVTLLGTVGFIASGKNKWHDFAKFRYKKQNLKELNILFERSEQLKENKRSDI